MRVSSGAEGPGLVSVCEPGAKLRAGVAALAGGRKAGLWSRLISQAEQSRGPNPSVAHTD